MQIREDGTVVIQSIFEKAPPSKKGPPMVVCDKAPRWHFPRYGWSVRANTKSEARAWMKKALGRYLPLPSGTVIHKETTCRS